MGTAPDPRFSLANERTFLAWLRSALALAAAGVAAAKALNFEHDVWRWVIALPPIAAAAVTASLAPGRWRRYEQAMREGEDLPVGGGLRLIGFGLAAYCVVALLAVVLDG